MLKLNSIQKTVEDIYIGNKNDFLIELKNLVSHKPTRFKIRSALDILFEPDFVFSTEKIILYKELLKVDIGNTPLLKNKEEVYLLNYLRIPNKIRYFFLGLRLI